MIKFDILSIFPEMFSSPLNFSLLKKNGFIVLGVSPDEEKNLKKISRWAKQKQINCYRLYDADLPEYAASRMATRPRTI